MAVKYFKAEIRPKKSYAEKEGVSAMAHCSDAFKTQKDYSQALENTLVEEGESLNDWFKPSIEQIEKPEYDQLLAELAEQTEDSEQYDFDDNGSQQSDDDFDFDQYEQDESRGDSTGEINQDSGEISAPKSTYRYFEFEKGHAGLIITTPQNDVWSASFVYTKDDPMVMQKFAKEFSSDENAAVNALGYFINHLTDIKNEQEALGGHVGPWYNKTVTGLAGGGDQRLINSIITEEDAMPILLEVAEEVQSTGERKEKAIDFDAMECDFEPVITAILNHRDYEKQPQGFIAKVRANLAKSFDGATDEQISAGAETVSSMHKIGHLSAQEDCAEAFELIFDDGITTPDEDQLGFPEQLPLTARAVTIVCEKYLGDKQVEPAKAVSEFFSCIDFDLADDEKISEYILAKVKNPHCFISGTTPMQLAIQMGCPRDYSSNPPSTESDVFDQMLANSKAKTQEAEKKPEAKPEKSVDTPAPTEKELESTQQPGAREIDDSDDFFAAFNGPAVSTVNEDLEPEVEQEENQEHELVDNFKAKVDEVNAQINALKPGERLVINDLDNDVYHACDGISSTKLKVAMESLMKYNAKYVAKTMPQDEVQPDHFKVGNLFHTMTLEPEKLHVEYFMLPKDYEKPTTPQFDKYDAWVKDGKPENQNLKPTDKVITAVEAHVADPESNKAPTAKQAADYQAWAEAGKPEPYKDAPTDLCIERCSQHYKLEKQAAGRVIVDFDGWQKAQAMADAVRSDEDTFRLANHESLKTEVSYFYRDPDTELLIKCRPDMELGTICGDLKSIALRSNPDEYYLINALRREVLNRAYHVSAAMYLHITGLEKWVWVFANKEEGYHWSAPIRASDKILEDGHAIYREYLEKIAEGHRTGVWPKPDSIQVKRDESGNTVIPTI